jgi:hypothetical protein
MVAIYFLFGLHIHAERESEREYIIMYGWIGTKCMQTAYNSIVLM